MNSEKVDTFIRKLKTISKLGPSEKIVIDEKSITIVDFNTYNYDRVKKQLYFETRFSSCKKLAELYRDIEEFSQTLMINPPPYWDENDILITLKRLDADLKQSCKGIRNLIRTYNDNKSIKADLETITERIDILTGKMDIYLANYKNQSQPQPQPQLHQQLHQQQPHQSQLPQYSPPKMFGFLESPKTEHPIISPSSSIPFSISEKIVQPIQASPQLQQVPEISREIESRKSELSQETEGFRKSELSQETEGFRKSEISRETEGFRKSEISREESDNNSISDSASDSDSDSNNPMGGLFD